MKCFFKSALLSLCTFTLSVQASDDGMFSGFKKGFLASPSSKKSSKGEAAALSSSNADDSKALVAFHVTDKCELNLLDLYKKAKDNPSVSLFQGNIELIKQYYTYLTWRQRYTRQDIPFLTGLSFVELDSNLKKIVFLDDCWVSNSHFESATKMF